MKMSSTQVCTCEVKFSFLVPVTELLEFNTSEINIDEIPWTIRVRKIAINARVSTLRNKKDAVDSAINLFLVCNYKKQAENLKWSIEAAATMKLISHNENSKSVEKKIPMVKFDDTKLMSSLENFIQWKELMDVKNHYVKEGMITFEAIITSRPILLSNVVPVCEVSSTKFGMVLHDVKNLKSIYSPKVTVRGIDWNVLFRKQDNNCLGIYLNMNTKIKHFAWSLLVKFTVKILSHNKDIKPIEKTLQHRYHFDSRGWGWSNFISWNELLNKNARHVENKHVFFDISLDVGPPEPFWNIEESCILNSQFAGTMRCPICLESFHDKDVSATRCGHLFCSDCIKSSIHLNKKCPLCNVPAAAADLRSIYC